MSGEASHPGFEPSGVKADWGARPVSKRRRLFNDPKPQNQASEPVGQPSQTEGSSTTNSGK